MGKVKKGQILTYGMGSISKDLLGGMVSTYLLVFYTDVFGLSAGMAGMIMMLSRLWDAINDPIMGAVVDKTNTKRGRYRPYILISPFFMALFYWLTFTTPGFESYYAKVAWAAITYTLAGMAFTAYDVPLWGMVPALSSSPAERNKFITSQRLFTMVACSIAASSAYPLIKKLGGGTSLAQTRTGYSRLVLIFGIIGILFSLLTYFTNKENIKMPKQKESAKTMFKVFLGNKHAQRLLLANLLIGLPGSIGSNVGIYFMTYNLGRPDLISVLMLLPMFGIMVGLLLAAPIVNKLGRQNAIRIGISVSIVANITLLLFGTNLIVLIVISILMSTVGGLPGIAIVSMIADAADYTQWKTHIRIDGIIFSLNSFIAKLGMALGIGISGLMLNIIGYVPGAAEQSQRTLFGLQFMRYGLPIAFLVAALVLLINYRLDDATMEQCQKELVELRESENAI